MACEFIAVSRKLAAFGFTKVEAWEQLAHYLRSFPLIVPTPSILDRARVFHTEQGWSFWDGLIAAACLESGVTRLYSEDLPGWAAPAPLEIINPFA